MSDKIVEITKKLMGGTFSIKCFPQLQYSKAECETIISEALNEVKRIEDLFTIFKDSTFNDINLNAGITPTKVTSEVIDLVSKSIELSKDTGGVFDISYACIEEMWKKAKADETLPTEKQIKEIKKFINYKDIIIDKDKETIFLKHKEMKISLGGIGKGYAVDMAYNKMRNRGIENFYINGAGDIRIHSAKTAKRAWKIGIRNPFNSDPNIFMGFLELRNNACATSGNYIKKINISGKEIHHIINKKTGYSTDGIVSSTVITDESILSDTMATISILLGQKKAIKFLNNKGIAAILVDKNGNTHLTSQALQYFEKYVKLKREENL